MDKYYVGWLWIYLHSQYEYLYYQFKCSNIDSIFNFKAYETGDFLRVVGQRLK